MNGHPLNLIAIIFHIEMFLGGLGDEWTPINQTDICVVVVLLKIYLLIVLTFRPQ